MASSGGLYIAAVAFFFMLQTVGQVGLVREITHEGGVKVEVNGEVWLYNPQTLTPGPDDARAPEKCSPGVVLSL